MRLAVLVAVAVLACTAPALAEDDDAAPDCGGYMQMQLDGTLTAPASVDSATVQSARQMIQVFPIDALFESVFADIRTRIDRALGDAPTDAARANIARLKSDLPSIQVLLKQDVVDLVATGIACHQNKSDLDIVAAFLQTPAGHKMIDATVTHAPMAPLSDDETTAVHDFTASDAAQRVFAQFTGGDSKTTLWIKAETVRFKDGIETWLRLKYGPDSIGGPV